jgi:hypothetical protein
MNHFFLVLEVVPTTNINFIFPTHRWHIMHTSENVMHSDPFLPIRPMTNIIGTTTFQWALPSLRSGRTRAFDATIFAAFQKWLANAFDGSVLLTACASKLSNVSHNLRCPTLIWQS